MAQVSNAQKLSAFNLGAIAKKVKKVESYDERAERIKKEKINFVELKRFIDDTHPTQEITENGAIQVQPFSITEDIGHLFQCCGEPETTNLAKQLGVGPSLFLMTTKFMSILFAILAVFNMPILYFYS